MKKLSHILLILIAISSLVIFITTLYSAVSTKNWSKVDAVVTSVYLPDGIVCGDFIDDKGVVHNDQPLYRDFKFQQFGAFKTVKKDDVNLFIGKKVTILYKDEQIIRYGSLWKNVVISLIAFLLSLLIILYKKKKST